MSFPVDPRNMYLGSYAEEDDVHEEEVIEEEETVEEDTTVETNEIDTPDEEKDETADNDFNFEIEEKIKEESIDEFAIPEKFDSIEQERDFYKNSFDKFKESYSNPDTIASKYEDTLLAKENNVEELKALRDALKGQPDAFVKIRFKDQLVKGGYDHRLNEAEQSEIINTELANVWGNNYKEVYDQDDASIPGTISYNMLQKQNEIISKINEYNQMPIQQQQQQPTVDVEEVKRTVYESLSKVGVKDENINRFMEDLKTSDLLNNPVKLYEAIYSKQIYSKKIAEAKEQGRKEALAEIKKVGSKPREEEAETEQEDSYANRYVDHYR